MISEEEAAVAAHVELGFGRLSFSATGPPEWLERQLERVLQAVESTLTSDVLDDEEVPEVQVDVEVDDATDEFSTSLASHIRAKGGESNQVQRFLATADWLRRRGTESLSTSAVTTALRDGQQKRLSNPSDALNKNVSKGFCEKTAKGFFITPDGLKALGYQ